MTKKPKQQDLYYKKIPELAAYIDRIGAEQLNFRRFMVKEYHGHYYRERSLIRLSPDGDISCTNPDHEPTAEEAKVIKAAWSQHDFPRTIGVNSIAALRPKLMTGSKVFEFWDRDKKEIVMVQERAQFRDGTKAYLPWSYFSDGNWRRMEPDGALPFWVPKDRRGKTNIMIHEGAKAAQFVDQLVNDPGRKKELEAHPWGKELSNYEHWGIIGGALAPHRADYAALRKEKPTTAVYVCDHDEKGEAVLQVFSKFYGASLTGIKFGDNFPYSFDLADPLPESLFNKKRYTGSPLWAFMKPATFATELIPNPAGSGRPITKLRSNFRDEWFHSVTPEAFVHKDWPDRVLTAPEFNSLIMPYSDVEDTARLLKKEDSSKANALRYDPSMKQGVYNSEKAGRYINTHVPSLIELEKGDYKPFIEFMNHLCPVEADRIELMRWCATLIARPDIKMLYGVLLISEAQGVGKGTLGEKILAPLMGEGNVSYPSETEIVDSGFNYWQAHKRLAVVHEIYAGHSVKGYNKLKSIITDKYITVSKKYVANYEIENWLHIFACSNSLRAIQLSVDDRRWLVPKISENKKPVAFWNDFNRWLSQEGGLGIIKYWAQEFLKKQEPVQRGEDAPWSQLKREIIEEGMSPGQLLVAQVLDVIKQEMNGTPIFILDTDLVSLIKDHLHEGRHSDRLEKPSTIRKVARSRGWFIGETRAYIDAWGTIGVGPRLLCSDLETAKKLPGSLAKEGRKPFNVDEFYSKHQKW